ncbi:hypothetical protein EV664_107129 [Stakelama pacifica]|uniref:Phage integrase family protein n=1 Tax=Stakelama pacifica TaxID=517720 RepID=A0A4R6FK90_9SPHN|nr:hypothetical protein EV664_107129 [Stakelama pacifica]
MLLSDATILWLTQHVAHLSAPERYEESLKVWEQFWEYLESVRALPDPLTIASIGTTIRINDEAVTLVDAFVNWRKAQGTSAPSISRDLAALRGPINWAKREHRITWAPFIKDVKGKKRPKELEWSPEQIAVILDAALASPDRHHVHLFTIIMLSTHARAEATLELHAEQIRKGLIYFLRPGEDQTSKRRAIVPACPTLAPWLAGKTGKIIVYRVPTSAKTRANGGPEYFERPTDNISNAFAGTLIAAHAMRPDLGFAEQRNDDDGKPRWLPPRAKLGETKRRPNLRAIGTPNTLRHTIHTWHKRRGVPDAQINAAAGHSEEGTGANYTHLRPEYLQELIESTEAFWREVGRYTNAHLRYQRDTKVVSIARKGLTG